MPEKYKIQTREEHNREIRKLWTICIVMASLLFLMSSASIFALLNQGHPWSYIVNIAVTIFDVIILSYGAGFFVPAFLSSLKKMSLAMDLSRLGLEVGQNTAKMIEETRKEIKPMIDRSEKTMDKVEKAVDKISKAFDDGFLDKLEEHIKVIRERIEKQTTPLKINRRSDAESDGSMLVEAGNEEKE